MYNNEVTYNKKWETEENKKALQKLESKYFDRSECSPGCPLSWAKEVLELMETLDKELGIRYNESTMRGFVIKGSPLDWFIVEPFNGVVRAFKHTFYVPKYGEKSFTKRIATLPKRVLDNFCHSIGYGFSSISAKYINKYKNKLFKKRIQLSQVKEKYGELRLYFNAGSAFEEYIENEVRKCEVKLSMKGAYYPLENLYNASTGYYVGTKHRPDIIKTTIKEDGSIDVNQTVYRGVMKELGVDLNEIEQKAKEQKTKSET